MLLILTAIVACTHVGPGTIVRDRFDYADAVAESWKRQPLNDRSTISYNLLTGETFARRLMSPIKPTLVMSLNEGGYPIDLVFRLLLLSINGIDNQYGGSSRAHAADPEFYRLIEELRKAQGNNFFALRVKKTEDNQTLIMVFRKKDQDIADDGGLVRRLLGLKETGTEFRVVYGSVSTADDEIALLTRSIIEIFSDISSIIEVPPEHVAEKRVTPTMQVKGEGFKPPLIGIHHSATPPGDAFVAVEYRDTWFWIDDQDYPSKKLFSFLIINMTLTETRGKDGEPIMTISAGR